MADFIFQYKIGDGIPSPPGFDYFQITEAVDTFYDYNLITDSVSETVDYGGLQV